MGLWSYPNQLAEVLKGSENIANTKLLFKVLSKEKEQSTQDYTAIFHTLEPPHPISAILVSRKRSSRLQPNPLSVLVFDFPSEMDLDQGHNILQTRRKIWNEAGLHGLLKTHAVF
jgi:hypothetical protein